MFGGMDDVTSKIAYAYAKQQAFVALALALIVGGASAAFEAGSNPAALGASIVVAAGAAYLLYLVYTQTNLAAITRPGLRLTGALFVVALLGWIAQAFLGGVDPTGGALLLALVLLLAAAAIAYPLPVRRGATVLYAPPAVRDLANGRSAATSAVALAGFGLARLLLPSALGPPDGAGLSGLALAAALVAIGAAGAVAHAMMANGAARTRILELLLVVGAGVSLLGVVGRSGSLAAWSLSLAPAFAALLGVVVTRFLSARLNQGKTIVSHRA